MLTHSHTHIVNIIIILYIIHYTPVCHLIRIWLWILIDWYFSFGCVQSTRRVENRLKIFEFQPNHCICILYVSRDCHFLTICAFFFIWWILWHPGLNGILHLRRLCLFFYFQFLFFYIIEKDFMVLRFHEIYLIEKKKISTHDVGKSLLLEQ